MRKWMMILLQTLQFQYSTKLAYLLHTYLIIFIIILLPEVGGTLIEETASR